MIPSYPGLRQAVLLLLAGFFLLILAISVIAVYLPGAERNPWVLGLVNIIVLGSLTWFGFERTGATVKQVFRIRRVDSALMGPMAAVILGSSILASEADNLLRYLLGPPPASFDLSRLYLSTQINPVASFFLLIIVAPVTEELLFRGIILRGFLRRLPVMKAVALSAVLFGLFHVNPWQITGAIFIGSILGWWYAQTGSLLPCLLGHASFNLLPLVAMFALPPIPGFTAIETGLQFHPLALDMLGLALTGFGIQRLQRAFELTGNLLTNPGLVDRAS